MSKKMMLVALAVISAAAFAVPAGASAQEIHINNVTSFAGTGNGGTFTAQEEPVITCEGPSHVTGTVSAGGTTGNLDVDLTGCHVTVFGTTIACKTAGAPVNNTIKQSGVFHAITINEKPGILGTAAATSLSCGSLSTMNVAGSLIGTITSPACGTASKSMTLKASATGSSQEHQVYTGVTYHPTLQTGTGTIKEAALTAEGTVESATAGTLECT